MVLLFVIAINNNFFAQTTTEKNISEKSEMYQSKSAGLFQLFSAVSESKEKHYSENIVYPSGGGTSTFILNSEIREEEVEKEKSILSEPEIEINTFPVPASDEFNIIYSIPENSPAVLNIYNVVGTKVISYSLPGDKTSLQISLDNYESGVYLYQVFVGEETKFAGKMIVLK